MKPEQLANHYFSKKARSAGWMTQRHEDRLSAGIPDLSFVAPDSQGWIEMKATTGDARIKTRIKQINWLCDRSRFDHFSGYVVCRVYKGKDEWLAAQVSPRDRDFLLSRELKPSNWHKLSRPFVTSDLILTLRWLSAPW